MILYGGKSTDLYFLPISTSFRHDLILKHHYLCPSAIDSDSLSHILKTEFFFLGRLAVQGWRKFEYFWATFGGVFFNFLW